MACETFSFADELFYVLDWGRIYFFLFSLNFFFSLEGLSKISSIASRRVRKIQVPCLEELRLESEFYKEVFSSEKRCLSMI